MMPSLTHCILSAPSCGRVIEAGLMMTGADGPASEQTRLSAAEPEGVVLEGHCSEPGLIKGP